MTQKLLLETLDDFASKNIVADVWLRDDDATQPSPALDRLIDLSEQYRVPMTLAVIPEPTGEALAQRLESMTGIDVAVHGWAHRNHARPDEKKKELGLHRPLATVLGELQTALTKLRSLHGARCIPMMVPPWNRIDQTIAAHLPQAGYEALSVYGPETSGSIPLLNTHIDVIDWRGTRGGKDHDLLFAETAMRMRQAQETGGMTGILTHHLDHDDSVWAFLDSLFTLTANHPGCRWRSSRQWLEQISP
ncbi:polysaccharide deacetylase family protein [Rhizobium skierniewicense]|uniref:polysaccharide deacetylase family protein n=1 Tax=Rhizobium skierniewicense TaxID=984260 RepID=UPI0015729095|nr:polysaccharide deacetylase family protein [Rhizobium skierniewicense]NTF33141.1 polysaccharide deacetylase family protein [Rhizobium skierniewicense]